MRIRPARAASVTSASASGTRRRERLLAEDVDAGLEQRAHDRVVGLLRRQDQRPVRARGGEQGLERREPRAESGLGPRPRERRGIGVHQAHHLHARHAPEEREVDLARHVAEPDHREPEHRRESRAYPVVNAGVGAAPSGWPRKRGRVRPPAEPGARGRREPARLGTDRRRRGGAWRARPWATPPRPCPASTRPGGAPPPAPDRSRTSAGTTATFQTAARVAILLRLAEPADLRRTRLQDVHGAGAQHLAEPDRRRLVLPRGDRACRAPPRPGRVPDSPRAARPAPRATRGRSGRAPGPCGSPPPASTDS